MNDMLRLGLAKAHAAWQFRWVGVGVAGAVATAVALGLQFYKDRYEASARVHVNTLTALKPLMREMTAQPDIDQQVRMLARTLITHPRVEKLVEPLGFVTSDTSALQRERVVSSLVTAIRFEGSAQGNIYTISYRDQDPVRARRLVHAVVEEFVQLNTVNKRLDSQQAREFIDTQILDYEKKLTESENRLKEFKIKNFGAAGAVANQDFFARMAGISDEVNRLRLELGAAEQSRDALRRELHSESPQLPREALPNRASLAPGEPESRLDAQRRLLDDLLRRYTEVHPDVIATRRSIAQLEAQRREEAEAARRAGGPGVAPTNPVFQQLRLSLAQAEAQVASLRSQLTVHQGRLDAVRSQASRMPQVEAELAQLNRDYDVIRRNYQQLVERRESAALGTKMDDSSQLANFRVIEPASIAPKPVVPSRAMLALAGYAAALAAGLAAAYGMTLLFPTLCAETELQAMTKRPVIGSVSIALDPASLRESHMRMVRFGGTTVLFLVASGAWLAWVLTTSRM